MKKWWCLLVVAGLLASCGPAQPIYKTEYEAIPPTTTQGRVCASSCLSTKQLCRQQCEILSGQCKIASSQRAQRDYNDYAAQREAEGRPIKKTVWEFEGSTFGNRLFIGDPNGCEGSADSCQQRCESDYIQCHTGCGGQMVMRTVCVGNCPVAVPTGSPVPARH